MNVKRWFNEMPAERRYPLVAYLLAFAAFLSLSLRDVLGKEYKDYKDYKDYVHILEHILFAAVALWTAIWGALAFSGDPVARRTHALGFSYFFVILSIAVFSIPTVLRQRSIGGEPVGIISGCVRDARAAEQIRCEQRFRRSEDQTTTAGQGVPAAPAAGAPEQAARHQRNQWVVNIGGALMAQGKCPPEVKDGDEAVGKAADKAVDQAVDQADIDERCALGSKDNRAYIFGGLVVPLPFVIIALAGGAISLSRRVPEIQRSSEPGYVPTDSMPRLTAQEVRERIEFQIVQFVSAPLVAVIAYQVIQPESDATSAALAFMSGFGSEAILQRVREFVDGGKLRLPSVAQAPAVGTVHGVVTQRRQGLEGVAVRVDGSTVSTRTGSGGLYCVTGLPPGPHQLSFEHNNVHKAVAVSVVAGTVTPCPVSMDDAQSCPPAGPQRETEPSAEPGDLRGVVEATGR